MRFVQAGVMLLGAIGYAAFLAWYYSISSWATEGTRDLSSLLTPGGWEPGKDIWGPVFQVFIPASIAWNAALLVVTVLVIVDSRKKVRAGDTAQLTQAVLMVKLAAIPFFLINFVPLALEAVDDSVLFFFGGFIGLAAVAGAAFLTYLTMLSTSIYGWASVSRLRRDQRISRAQAVIYSLLLCLFVLDTLAGILLFAETRRARRAAAVPVTAS